MKAVVTTGHGGYEKLEYRDVPIPIPGPGEVVLKVLAAGVNNTDVNTRLGWYSSSVQSGTNRLSTAGEGSPIEKGGWNSTTPFPLIQGTDCCGEVVLLGAGVTGPKAGTRVLVRPCMRVKGFSSPENIWMGSDFDGAFAQYLRVPAREVFEVCCEWSSIELATLPCAYGTAENMLERTGVGTSDHVLVTGASGGVGSAVVQLAKRRGARVTAVAGDTKTGSVRNLGADTVIPRGSDLCAELGGAGITVAIDNVAGENFGTILKIIARGGRYASSGAIAGPMVTLDMRDLYLRDLNLIGCTAWDEQVFPNLIGYIERGEIRPLVAQTFDLQEIAIAQQKFMQKRHFGNFVLIPPP
ncbi:alcohol dehydrogenase family protein [Alkalispirochaeta sphaeroplastigenens]|nr:alcohol dehydrogenase family protein [Alkalispirochaeta sphaeroplastigenens]